MSKSEGVGVFSLLNKENQWAWVTDREVKCMFSYNQYALLSAGPNGSIEEQTIGFNWRHRFTAVIKFKKREVDS